MNKDTNSNERKMGESGRLRHNRRLLRVVIALSSPIALTVLILSASTHVYAQIQRSSADAELLLNSGDQTVFTASKRAQKISDVPAAVTIITDKDIAASGAVTLLDVLRSAPGVDVIEANRSTADVSIRGFNTPFSNKLLVMIDGRSIYITAYGSVFWHTEPILISRIKRIEIVRGAGSALYGANAFNGVINIITKLPAEMAAEPAKTSVRTVVGEQNSTFSEFQHSGGNPKDWSYSIGAGYNRTDGFGGRAAGQPRDSFTTPTLTLDAQKRLKRGSIQLSAGDSEATSDFNETLSYNDAKFHTGYLSATYNEDRAKDPILARVYGNFFRLNNQGKRDVTIDTYDFEVQQSRSLSPSHSLIYGTSYRHVRASTFATGSESHSEELFALYAQDDFRLAKSTHLFGGVRFDEHSVYGFNFTPRLSLVHHMPGKQSVRLSYGTSFRNPSLVETYLDYRIDLGPGLTSVATGNKDLKPEKVTSYELGYRKEIRGGYLGANLFYNQVSGLITTVPTAFAPSPPFPAGIPIASTYRNLNSATALGAELEGECRIAEGIRGLANYAYQDVESGNHTRVDFSPQHKFNLGVQAKLSAAADAYLGMHFVGSSVYHAQTGVLAIPAYARVDGRIGYRFGTSKRSWTLSALVTNLFDDKHVEVPAQMVPGSAVQSAQQRRSVYFMLSGKF